MDWGENETEGGIGMANGGGAWGGLGSLLSYIVVESEGGGV